MKVSHRQKIVVELIFDSSRTRIFHELYPHQYLIDLDDDDDDTNYQLSWYKVRNNTLKQQ